jgi:hypothetical protein
MTDAAKRWAQQQHDRAKEIVGPELYETFVSMLGQEPLTPERVLILMASAWKAGRNNNDLGRELEEVREMRRRFCDARTMAEVRAIYTQGTLTGRGPDQGKNAST